MVSLAHLRAIPAVLALSLALACSGGSSPEAGEVLRETTPAAASARQFTAVAGGICAATAEAATDAEQARVTFFAEVHDGLHTIAHDLLAVDRKAAADVLRAKEHVESTLSASPAPTAELNSALADLQAATRAGLARLDVTVAPCPSP